MEKFIVIMLSVAIIVAWSIYTDGVPKVYRTRKCTGRHWKAAFPNSSNQEIREFLSLFCSAFAFSSSQKLKFAPNDRLLDIYKVLYPSKWMADALEFESLAEELSKHHGVDFDAVWHEELTLGELFSQVKSA